MGITLLTAPAIEPVTLAEARAHLRYAPGDTSQDAAIEMWIGEARRNAEAQLSRGIIRQQWRLTLADFPSICGAISLPLGPLIVVDEVSYLDTAGVEQFLDPEADYFVDETIEPARIVPAYSKYWPLARCQPDAVRVIFSVGYGEKATDVPAGIKAWILMRVAAANENREAVVVDKSLVIAPMPFVDGLLDPYRIIRF